MAACLILAALAVAIAITLQGCESGGSDENNDSLDQMVCIVDSTVLGTQEGSRMELSWRHSFRTDQAECDRCCRAIRQYEAASPNASLAEICDAALHLSAGSVVAACQPGCPSSNIPPASAAALCTPCEVGKRSASGRGVCSDCAAGRWSGSLGTTECAACPGGRFSEESGATNSSTCSACSVGKTSDPASSICDDCDRGSFNELAGASACELCPMSTYSQSLGATSRTTCLNCSAGSFSAYRGATDCSACQRGRYSPGAVSTCLECGVGEFQDVAGSSSCKKCPSGTFSDAIAATSRETCQPCPNGTYSVGHAAACTPCTAGKFASALGLTECMDCPVGSDTPAGAHSCCPPHGEDWPDEPPILSVPPGRYWTDVHRLPIPCPEDEVDIPGAEVVDAVGEGDRVLSLGAVHVGTLHQGKSYSCISLKCGPSLCGVIPPPSSQLMPGNQLQVAAFVGRYNETLESSSLHQCGDHVLIEFSSFGCEQNTVLTFLGTLVGVVSLTIICGIAFDQAFRWRVQVFVESSLTITPAEDKTPSDPADSTVEPAELDVIPTVRDVREDLRAALHQRFTNLTLANLDVYKLIGSNPDGASGVLVEYKLGVRRAQLEELRQYLLGLVWSAGPSWSRSIVVAQQPPSRVKEAARLPGADLLEACESCMLTVFGCCGVDIPAADANLLHLTVARAVLNRLMTSSAALLIALQGLANVFMIILLPSVAVWSMNCSDGYPLGLHGIWALYVCLTSYLVNWILIRSLHDTYVGDDLKKFLSRFRLRLLFRFLAMVISVTDLYQDATFPAIAGTCGFDLWWVSLWLVMLGVGVMQFLMQLLLIIASWRRYHNAQTPEERERHHIEGLFLALRGCDNHPLVYIVKPAVEERLGGCSSWAMKTVEARVAFLRFVFEDAEQCALQVSFLLYFDQASLADQIWVGSSCGTSLLLSFTLCVQTLPEVRDWLWHQLLSKMPFGVRSPEARLVWLLIFVALYRAISIFPWLGACTPAGSHDASTLSRLLLMSDNRPPSHILQETITGSVLALLCTCIVMAISICVWGRQLKLPRFLFLRWCKPCVKYFREVLPCCKKEPRSAKPVSGILKSAKTNAWDGTESKPVGPKQNEDYEFETRLNAGAQLRLKSDQDQDAWLPSLRLLYTAAVDKKHDEALDVLEELDARIVWLVQNPGACDRTSIINKRRKIDSRINELATMGLAAPLPPDASAPGGAADTLEALRASAAGVLDLAALRSHVLRLLADRSFRSARLLQKAEMIEQTTDCRSRLLLLHWSAIAEAGAIPKYSSTWPCAEPVSAAIQRVIGSTDITEEEAERRVVPVYFSHSWSRKAHPDTGNHAKAKTLVRFAKWLMSVAKRQGLDCEVFFWIDYSCVEGDSDIAVTSLPLFVGSCMQVLTWRTPDFDRRCWTMLERLLAYSFCSGGLTPYAVDYSSFRTPSELSAERLQSVKTADVVEDEEDEKLGAAAGDADDGAVVGIDADVAVVCPSVAPEKSAASVAPSVEDDDVVHLEVRRRSRKLPHPLDPLVCKMNVTTAQAQRRQVQQLVETALAVPALEIFADRQPVDFGLTEVIEQLLGPYQPVASGEDGSLTFAWEDTVSADAGKWLTAAEAPKTSHEWRLVVEPAGTNTKKAAQYRIGDDDGAIVLVDHGPGDSAEPATAPEPADIEQLFDELDKAYMALTAGACVGSHKPSSHLEAISVALVTALRADLAAAEASGDESSLRGALMRTRDVELPEKERLTRLLCDMQLQNAMAAHDIQGLRMAIRFTRQSFAIDDVPSDLAERISQAAAAVKQLQKEQLQARALSVVQQDDPDPAAVVSVVEVSRNEGWDNVAKEALQVLGKILDGAKAAENVALVVEVHRLATEQNIHAAMTVTSGVLADWTDEMLVRRDTTNLILLADAADAGGCDDIAKSVIDSLCTLVEELQRSCSDLATREGAKESLQDMLEVAKKYHRNRLVDAIDAAMQEAQAAEQTKRAEMLAVARSADDPAEIVRAATVAHQWAWDDVFAEAQRGFQLQVRRHAGKHDKQTIRHLVVLHDVAQESQLNELINMTTPALADLLSDMKTRGNGKALVEMADIAHRHGCGPFAGQVRQVLRELIDRWHRSATDDAQERLREAMEEAERCGDTIITSLAGDALSEVTAHKEAEKERMEDARQRIRAATDFGEIIEGLDLATRSGWTDIAQEAHDKIAERIRSPGTTVLEVAEIYSVTAARKMHSAKDLAKTRFEKRIDDAKMKSDWATVLRGAHHAASLGCTGLAEAPMKSVKKRINKWKQSGGRLPDEARSLMEAARDIGESEMADALSKRIELGEYLSASDSSDIQALVQLMQDAQTAGCPRIQADALKAVEHRVDKWKDSGSMDELRSARETLQHAGLTELVQKIHEVVELADTLNAAKASGDTAQLIFVTSAARGTGCTSIMREATSSLKQRISRLGKDARKFKDLQELHDAARSAGLDDIADLAVEAVGGILPKDWVAKGVTKMPALSKVKAQNEDLIKRIERMLNSCFKGWGKLGPDAVTRDRYKKGNPLATSLKVEEVVHVENAANYLGYSVRRAEVIKQFKALSADEQKNSWNLKTHQVSLKGVWRHPEEPVDAAVNECWLFHGTSEAGATGITDTDFDMARAGSATGTMFGRGLYFTESTMKADEYTGQDSRGWSPLLLCRVMLGRINHCDAVAPWEMSEELEASCKGGGYHSVMGDREAVRGTYRELIVFDNDQVYPEYLVWYSRVAPFKPY